GNTGATRVSNAAAPTRGGNSRPRRLSVADVSNAKLAYLLDGDRHPRRAAIEDVPRRLLGTARAGGGGSVARSEARRDLRSARPQRRRKDDDAQDAAGVRPADARARVRRGASGGLARGAQGDRILAREPSPLRILDRRRVPSLRRPARGAVAKRCDGAGAQAAGGRRAGRTRGPIDPEVFQRNGAAARSGAGADRRSAD